MPGSFKDIKVYHMAYKLAMNIFEISKSFPEAEMFSLTDQIRRSSRAVCSNIAEAYRKRRHPKHFSLRIYDADSEASETLVWLDFAKDCGYISLRKHKSLSSEYEEIGRMLGGIAKQAELFIPK
jgi:four helix bundle protein